MGDSGVTTLNLFATSSEKEYTSEPYKTIGWGGSGNFVKMTLEDINVPDGKLLSLIHIYQNRKSDSGSFRAPYL